MTRYFLNIVLILTLAACASTDTTEQAEEDYPFDLSIFDEEEGRYCIPMRNIRTTDVLGDRALLFRMRSGEDYINILPHKCVGLRPNRPLMYETRQNQLCHLDIVRILDNSGFGLRPIMSCGLGRFHPVPEGMPIADDVDE